MSIELHPGIFWPLPPCPHFGQIYRTKFTQPLLLCLISGQPHLPLHADVHYEWSLWQKFVLFSIANYADLANENSTHKLQPQLITALHNIIAQHQIKNDKTKMPGKIIVSSRGSLHLYDASLGKGVALKEGGLIVSVKCTLISR